MVIPGWIPPHSMEGRTMTQTADPGAILQWKPIRPYPNVYIGLA